FCFRCGPPIRHRGQHGPEKAGTLGRLWLKAVWIEQSCRVVMAIAVKCEVRRLKDTAHARQVRITPPTGGERWRLICKSLTGARQMFAQRRIRAHPFREPWIEVARPEVIEPGLRVELLGGEEVVHRQRGRNLLQPHFAE